MKITVSTGQETLLDKAESKADKAVLKAKKALRDVKRDARDVTGNSNLAKDMGDQVRNVIEKAGLKIKNIKKKIN